ncbi:hypothetical protein SAMN04487905_10874 [Actinopolyspora xinjiangensis]|uniref:Uncharacterized protein n=1 Tax=Actinopolyspora xinjiangensis TaxID=405564 RepID=A0A1H0V871_9ACTN|nr:hypothetical protein [Actinopolyspora xinjiangensis]SDP74591.1 hypothetical protein SAMN04487905_10874 [Actinopolyspora xinjiangensis]
MGEDERREFTVTTARRVVESLAPEELPAFAATSEAFLRDPERLLAGRRCGDEALGSGIDTVVALLSPAALAVAAAVYDQLVDRAGDAVVRGGDRVLSRLRARFRRRSAVEGDEDSATEPETAEPETAGSLTTGPLTDEQRERVREVAEARARALGLTEDRVRLLVGAIVDSLDRED